MQIEHTQRELQEIVFSEMRNNNLKYDYDSTKIKEGNQGDMPYRTVKKKMSEEKINTVHIWGRGGCGRSRGNSRGSSRASVRRVMAVRGSTRARTSHGREVIVPQLVVRVMVWQQ